MPRVYVSDFGLAGGQADGLSPLLGSRLTRTGVTLGTPAYMSPELARGEVHALTPASDVWALGCVLFECLAGRRAFEGPDEAAVIGAILTQRPARPAAATGPVWAVLRETLARRPRSRPRNAAASLLREALALAPERADLRLKLGLARWAAGAGGDAVPAWRAIDPHAPEADAAALYLGLERFFAWNVETTAFEWDAARPLLQAAAGRPGRPGALARAALATTDGRWDAARAELGDDPGWEAALLRGFIGATTPGDDVPAGLREYERALADGIEFAWAWQNVANGRLGLGDGEGALAAANRALQLAPGFSFAFNTRGLARRRLGDRRAAIAEFRRAVEADARNVAALANLGATLFEVHEYAEAAAVLARYCAQRPADGVIRADLALARYRAGDEAGGWAEVERALADAPAEAMPWQARGVMRSQAGEVEAALADFDAALARDPELAVAYRWRGLARARLHRPREALADFDRLLALVPGDADDFRERGVVRSDLGDYDGALADLAEAKRRAPEDLRLRHDCAIVHYRRGDLPGAVAELEAVLAVAPDDDQALLGVATMREAQGDAAGALAAFRRYVAAHPGGERADEVRARLAALAAAAGTPR